MMIVMKEGATEAEIAAICKPRLVGQVITATLTGDKPASFRLTWRTDTRARNRLQQRSFGKRILFTNRDDWPVAEVVAAYRDGFADAGADELIYFPSSTDVSQVDLLANALL